MTDIPALRQLEESLVASIAREQRRRGQRRWVRLAASAAAVVLLATATVVGGLRPADDAEGPSGPLRVSAAAAQVSVDEDAGAYVIEFANLQAHPEAVREALARHGLDIHVQFVPVSPSMVGELVASSSDDPGSDAVTYEYRQGDIPSADVVAARVPLGYRGRTDLTIGRRAEDGEPFVSAAVSAFEPGEALHCAHPDVSLTVRELVPVVEERGLRVIWRDHAGRPVTPDQVVDQYVNSASPHAPGEVLVTTMEQDPGNPLTPEYQAYLRSGCA